MSTSMMNGNFGSLSSSYMMLQFQNNVDQAKTQDKMFNKWDEYIKQ